jgi:hypothetical protein
MTERPPAEPDDLAPWADDDLVRALRAPGSAAELGDEQRYVSAFRDAGRSNVRSLPARAVGRLGAGGTAVVVTVALTSGVAAAYTGHLPDPVQRIAHSVIGAPPPNAHVHRVPEASGTPGPGSTMSPGLGGATTPPGSPSTSGASLPGVPEASATPGGHTTSGAGPSQGPSASPTGEPTGTASPTSPVSSAAAALSISAAAHRVGLGQTSVLSSVVTDDTGAALAGQGVVLQERGPRLRHWRTVVQATTDSTGLATATTPPATRTERFRWHAGPGVHSTPWLMQMVPTLTVTAETAGSTTSIIPATQGALPGDRIQLFRHVAGHTRLVRRASLDSTGSATISVLTPHRRASYVVRLLRTRLHAGARGRVVVVPPRPAAVSISGSAARVTDGGSVVINGVVTSATGAALPGHRVVLWRRGPMRWRRVGHAISDGNGYVAIATPPVTATARFRLRTDHRAHSPAFRVVELPVLDVSAQRVSGTVTVSATATGTRAGDKVVLLRRAGGRLVKLRHARLGPGGSVTFSVPARKARTTYVVRVPATRVHGLAAASVVVRRG